ncbi:uncharacterized protein LOC132050867 [Lycium ferocissimum]|uniref:uncharacterized protein LOC132050867 n=1 Tax=Lycium ferocissimum TaxID=112874 RepID=UPI0028158ADB|nr:uncharacterized protein LOC132050867 [Lycium ferocissimum]
MGNCIVLRQNDKKNVLEYKAPMKVHEVSPLLTEPQAKQVKKKVRFADEVVKESSKGCSEVVRIKVVITKQELQALLNEGGLRLDDGMVQYPLQKEPSSVAEINSSSSFTDNDTNDCIGWRPALDSIPELD